jgi:hypothetical protein
MTSERMRTSLPDRPLAGCVSGRRNRDPVALSLQSEMVRGLKRQIAVIGLSDGIADSRAFMMLRQLRRGGDG